MAQLPWSARMAVQLLEMRHGCATCACVSAPGPVAGSPLARRPPYHCCIGKVLGKPDLGVKVLEGGEQARGGGGWTPAVRVGGCAAAAHVAAMRDVLAWRPGGLRRRLRGAPGLHGFLLRVSSTCLDRLWRRRHGTPACNELP